MKNNILFWIIGTVVLVGLVVGFTSKDPVTIVKEIKEVGGVPGPDRDFRCETVNRAMKCYDRVGFSSATTTPLAIKSPNFATSTLNTTASICTFTTSSTTASTVTLAKATTAYATTTLIRTESVGANARATFRVASSTVATAAALALDQTNTTFSPADYLVMGMAGGVGTFSPTGFCSIEWSVAY